jgi:hypothetical protein
MRYLAREYSHGTIIHGLPIDSYVHYAKITSAINRNRVFHESNEDEEECIKAPYPYSIIKLELMCQGGLFSQVHLLISREPQKDGLI